LRELIYALQGLDGKLFQKDPKDMQSITIKVDMERSVRMQVLRFLECGWLYLKLRKFLTAFNHNPSAGLVLQVIAHAHLSTHYLELISYISRLFVLIYQLSSRNTIVC
jgi:hypothetical protein